MKEIFLLRHAEAAEKTGTRTDKDRELSARGKKDAARIGSYLADSGDLPQVIFCSTAIRARQTIMLALEKIARDRITIHYEEELYEATQENVADFIRRIDDKFDRAMLVGHNPAFSAVSRNLSPRSPDHIAAGGLVVITFSSTSWEEVNSASAESTQYVQPQTE